MNKYISSCRVTYPEPQSNKEQVTKKSSICPLTPLKQLITDELRQLQKFNWPDRNCTPLNESKIQFLATLTFHTLFPDARGGSTKKLLERR